MFEEQLIKAVKANTCLYDKSSKSYRNKSKKEKAWFAVSNAIGVDVKQCQSRWRSLRDRFLKELHKKPKSVNWALEEKEWTFFPALQFLKAHVAPRRTFSNSLWDTKEEVVNPTETSASTFFEESDIASNRIEALLGRVHDDLPSTKHFLLSTPDTSQASADTASKPASARKRKIVEEATDRFNVLLGAATDFLSKREPRGRNDYFYKVLDSYLIKLPEDIQDDLKSFFLKKVFEEIEKGK